MLDHEVEDDAARAGFWRRHWKVALRVAIYGGMLLLVAIAAIGLFLPVEEPAVVKRVVAEKSERATPQKPVHAAPETTTTQTAAQPERIDPDYLDQRFDQIRGRMVNYESLFSNKDSAVDGKKVAERIEKRVAKLKGWIAEIDVMSRTQDYKKTNEAIYELGEEIHYLMKSIDGYDWAKQGQAAFRQLGNELEARELEHFIRHEHWVTAAKLCEYRRDYGQSIYYWRKAGGYEGRMRSVLSMFMIPYSSRGMNQKTMPDRVFFVGVPEEDSTLFLQMLGRKDWRMQVETDGRVRSMQ